MKSDTPKITLIYCFCDPCFNATVQTFRLVDYVILLNLIVLGMTIKFDKVHSWLVRPT